MCSFFIILRTVTVFVYSTVLYSPFLKLDLETHHEYMLLQTAGQLLEIPREIPNSTLDSLVPSDPRSKYSRLHEKVAQFGESLCPHPGKFLRVRQQHPGNTTLIVADRRGDRSIVSLINTAHIQLRY